MVPLVYLLVTYGPMNAVSCYPLSTVNLLMSYRRVFVLLRSTYMYVYLHM